MVALSTSLRTAQPAVWQAILLIPLAGFYLLSSLFLSPLIVRNLGGRECLSAFVTSPQWLQLANGLSPQTQTVLALIRVKY